jgi:hypothetical protein
MGKRSNFERIPRDLYPTPAKAVQPLIPYLRAARIGSFAEPCCGNGDLVRHLEGYDLTCAYRGDIATGQDALASDRYGDSDIVIIGRVKWFPDSEHGSKDNFGWFRFAADHRGVTAIHNTRSKQRAGVTPVLGGEFRYVLHAEVPRMAADGWERLPALDGTHHGEYSALMRKAAEGQT